MNVTTVPTASAIGAGSISSTAPPTIDTRDGGRWMAPLDRSREPTKPNFQSSLRHAAVDETRDGSGRRGGSTVVMPRHDRNLP